MDSIDQDAREATPPRFSYMAYRLAQSLVPDHLEITEFHSPCGTDLELTLDRMRGKLILEAYRDGDLLGEPLEIFDCGMGASLLGNDWLELPGEALILRILQTEKALRA